MWFTHRLLLSVLVGSNMSLRSLAAAHSTSASLVNAASLLRYLRVPWMKEPTKTPLYFTISQYLWSAQKEQVKKLCGWTAELFELVVHSYCSIWRIVAGESGWFFPESNWRCSGWKIFYSSVKSARKSGGGEMNDSWANPVPTLMGNRWRRGDI